MSRRKNKQSITSQKTNTGETTMTEQNQPESTDVSEETTQPEVAVDETSTEEQKPAEDLTPAAAEEPKEETPKEEEKPDEEIEEEPIAEEKKPTSSYPVLDSGELSEFLKDDVVVKYVTACVRAFNILKSAKPANRNSVKENLVNFLKSYRGAVARSEITNENYTRGFSRAVVSSKEQMAQFVGLVFELSSNRPILKEVLQGRELNGYFSTWNDGQKKALCMTLVKEAIAETYEQ